MLRPTWMLDNFHELANELATGNSKFSVHAVRAVVRDRGTGR